MLFQPIRNPHIHCEPVLSLWLFKTSFINIVVLCGWRIFWLFRSCFVVAFWCWRWSDNSLAKLETCQPPLLSVFFWGITSSYLCILKTQVVAFFWNLFCYMFAVGWLVSALQFSVIGGFPFTCFMCIFNLGMKKPELKLTQTKCNGNKQGK